MKAEVEWVPGDGEARKVSHWGRKTFAWWKKYAHSRGEQRPTTFIVVQPFGRAGERERSVEFRDDQLRQAKTHAKQWVTDGGLSASVAGHVRVPFDDTYVVEEFGEYRPTEDRTVWIWDVRDDGMPYGRRGPYRDVDEAYREARTSAQATTRDQVVTLGSEPTARSFEILKAYKARSGEVFFTTELAHVGRRLGEYR